MYDVAMQISGSDYDTMFKLDADALIADVCSKFSVPVVVELNVDHIFDMNVVMIGVRYGHI